MFFSDKLNDNKEKNMKSILFSTRKISKYERERKIGDEK